jgi:hypothetical protein
MLAVLGAPAFEYFVVVAAESDWKLKIIDVVAGFDLREKRRVDLQIPSRIVELPGDDAVEIEVFH